MNDPKSLRSTSPILVLGLTLLIAALDVDADWLVTREGQRIETLGAWEIRGPMIVFTAAGGTLSSMRLSEIDLDASRAATEETANPSTEARVPAAPRASVLKITDRDVGRGQSGSGGPERLVASLQSSHRYQDIPRAMGLFNWQDTPQEFRDYMESELEWLMERTIQSIELTEVAPDQKLREVHDGTTYEPNVEVTHQMEIELVPDAEDERRGLKVYVGTRLGAYFIAAARPAAEQVLGTPP